MHHRFSFCEVMGVIAFAAIASFVAVSCATIMHGTSQDVGIMSKPSGASVTVDNKPLGQTPVVANLSRKDHHIVKIEMEGFQPYEAAMTRSTSGWVWGNIVFGGLIGLAVDAITGGLYKLKPEQIEGTLDQTTTSSIEGADIIIAVVLRPDSSWEKVGELVPSERE